MKERIEKIIFIITITIISLVMIYWIGQKQGFHEDEIFSYGSSNYNLDNVFQRYGKKDEVNKIIFDEILQGDIINITNNIKNIIGNPNIFMERLHELESKEKPIWKAKEEAREYLTIGKEDIFNYFYVYYNQLRDVHPPLFYFLVHLVSTIFFGTFSKYIIFIINLIFLILTLIILRKILNLLNKKYLTIPLIILYGLSIGAASTVVFLRMYQMLVFFILASLYIHIKIIKNNFEIDKKTRNKLIAITVLGFLTQYYFCIFALFEFLTLLVILIKNKKKEELKKYAKYTIISGVLGVLIFPASIYHIFFSYRGVGASGKDSSLIESIFTYFKEISYSFSISEIVLIVIFAISLAIYITYLIKNYKKQKEKTNLELSAIIIIPQILFFIVVCKISPMMQENTINRYISACIPLISLAVILILDYIASKFINKKIIITLILSIMTMSLSIYGLITNEPRYLYKGYDEVLKIAKENQSTNYIYICDNNFTYLSSLPEFLVYDKSLIINYNIDNLEILKENSELQDKNEIILCVKKWLNVDQILEEVKNNTDFKNSRVILDNNELQSVIFRISNNG